MKVLEKFEFYLDGIPKKAEEYKNRKEILMLLGRVMSDGKFSELFSDINILDTSVFVLINIKEPQNDFEDIRLGYISTGITDIKKLLKVIVPVFYNCFPNVSNIMLYAITKDRFDNTDLDTLGMEFTSSILNKIKSGYFKDYDFTKSGELYDAQRVVVDYLANDASLDINYSEDSLTFNKVVEENKLRADNFNVLNLYFVYSFDINYDEYNNQYDITDYEIIPFDLKNNEKSITNVILN